MPIYANMYTYINAYIHRLIHTYIQVYTYKHSYYRQLQLNVVAMVTLIMQTGDIWIQVSYSFNNTIIQITVALNLIK